MFFIARGIEMSELDQQESVIVFDNLVRSVAGDKKSLKVASHNIEPFVASNGAGTLRSFDSREAVMEIASHSGARVKGILAS